MNVQSSPDTRVKVAIIGSGNIGSDLMYKLLKQPGHMELALLAGIDPASEGLAHARSLGIASSAEGINAIVENILNPATPPIMMRNTVYAIPERDFDEAKVVASIERMEAEVQSYVPGYHLKNPLIFDIQETPWGKKTVIVLLLEVEGAGDYLPKYAGNLDIMTSAARRVGEMMAQRLLRAKEGVL